MDYLELRFSEIMQYKVSEQDTSFLDCKHKHMMKSGAPPNKFIVQGLYLFNETF